MLKTDRIKRKKRIRAKLSGTIERPRLSVFRSNKFIYAQLVNDDLGVTLCEAHGADPKAVGSDIAKKATTHKVKAVVFDRNGFLYHGRIKVLADAAREAGLTF